MVRLQILFPAIALWWFWHSAIAFIPRPAACFACFAGPQLILMVVAASRAIAVFDAIGADVIIWWFPVRARDIEPTPAFASAAMARPNQLIIQSG